MSKKVLVHDDRTKSITFLQAIQEPAYVNVITTLHAHIDTFQSEDFGYLPPHLCMMGLATQMHKNARARVQDMFSTAQHAHGIQDPLIQGFIPPQVYRLDNNKSYNTATTSDLSAMTLSRSGGHEGSRPLLNTQHVSIQGRAHEPCNAVAGRGRYVRPDHN
jgi:hypothetical protein